MCVNTGDLIFAEKNHMFASPRALLRRGASSHSHTQGAPKNKNMALRRASQRTGTGTWHPTSMNEVSIASARRRLRFHGVRTLREE